MATIAPRYLPSPEEIASATATFDAERQAAFDATADARRANRHAACMRQRIRRLQGLADDVIDVVSLRLAYSHENGPRPMADKALRGLYELATGRKPDGQEMQAMRLWDAELLRETEATKRDMSRRDVANVELIDDLELAEAAGMICDCVGLQSRLNDMTGRWVTREEVVPLKIKSAATVRFRSGL